MCPVSGSHVNLHRFFHGFGQEKEEEKGGTRLDSGLDVTVPHRLGGKGGTEDQRKFYGVTGQISDKFPLFFLSQKLGKILL